MIQTIQPRTNFPVSRIIPNPADTATYYPQAVVRKAADGTLLGSVNLASQGNNIYAGTFAMPADSTGRGQFITITTSIYTDAGRTTKSDVYGEDTDTYFLYDQFNLVQGLATQISALIGDRGGVDVDYKKIRKIFEEAAAKIKPLEEKEPDLSILVPHFDRVITRIEKCIDEKEVTELPDIQEQKEVDLTPILNAFANGVSLIMKAISSIPEPTETDLEPVMKKLDAADQTQTLKKITAAVEALNKLKDVIEKMPAITKQVDDLEQRIGKDLIAAASMKSQEKPAPTPPAPPSLTGANRNGFVRTS